MKKILCTVAIVVYLAGYAWPAATSGAEDKVFTPYDLPKAFAENPNEAKVQYIDKTVQIKGIVVGKGMSRYMTPNVELSESGKGPAPAICVFPYVGIAYWNRSDQIAGFEQGQTVTISGRVISLNENRVVLKESKTVEQTRHRTHGYPATDQGNNGDDGMKYLALICVIALGGWIKLNTFKKSFNECSTGEKRIRLVVAVICGVYAVYAMIVALWS